MKWKIKVGSKREFFMDDGGKPGDKLADDAFLEGTVIQSGAMASNTMDGASYGFVKFEVWVCVGTAASPTEYAEPVA